jgi:glyoxylase-like metal-dependent hydrolase (beta-lactamase superfamily II)
MVSIREQLLVLDPETEVFPGHGPISTIGTEIMSNPFIIN